jgi:uncharacterized protein (TIGR02677 family)
MPFDRLKPFAYLNAEKTPLYRAIMAALIEAKRHFEIHLRPAEIADSLRGIQEVPETSDAEIEDALGQLCKWGNLRRTQDTSDVRTVEEFYRPRYLYQLTQEGEAAERAVQSYEESILRSGELQTAALSVIRDQLHALLKCTTSGELDGKKLHLCLSTLRNYFDQLTTKAQLFIGSIQRAIDLHGYELEVFIAYKERLIDYLERFIGELVVATGEISGVINRIEHAGVAAIIGAAAQHEVVDSMDSGPEAIETASREWSLRWNGLKKWFIGTDGASSQAETLRSCARSAIPSLLVAISGIHDRRSASSDRPTDLKTLARWFAEVDSDDDAHRLWRTAFALNPARHLRIDDDTLEAWDQVPIAPTTSWVDSNPILISPRLRKTGQQHRRGRPSNVIDRTADKRRLAALAAEEAEQIEKARLRLATGETTRLSEFSELDRNEFHLLLDLLGKALGEQRKPTEEVVTTSGDGSMQIVLNRTPDKTIACIQTSDGLFSGCDHFVRITDLTKLPEAAERFLDQVDEELPIHE